MSMSAQATPTPKLVVHGRQLVAASWALPVQLALLALPVLLAQRVLLVQPVPLV